jgi:preprotein translocase subunit SecA
MDRIDEEILKWVYLFQPVSGPTEDDPSGAGPRGGAPAVQVREPELAFAGSGRSLPRNLSMNDPTEAPTAFARAEPKEAQGGGDEVATVRREGKKVGRNDPCPCGSGKKYKKCHGGG